MKDKTAAFPPTSTVTVDPQMEIRSLNETIRLRTEELEDTRQKLDIAITQIVMLKAQFKQASPSPDGSMAVLCRFGSDIVAIGQSWAEDAGMPLPEFIEREAVLALQAAWQG